MADQVALKILRGKDIWKPGWTGGDGTPSVADWVCLREILNLVGTRSPAQVLRLYKDSPWAKTLKERHPSEGWLSRTYKAALKSALKAERKLNVKPTLDDLWNDPCWVSDAGNAWYIALKYPNEVLAVWSGGRKDRFLGWYRYNSKCWTPEGAGAAVRALVEKGLRARRVEAAGRDRDDILKVAKLSSYVMKGCADILKGKLNVTAAAFNRDPLLLNVQNGVLNLETGELVKHDPSQRFSYCLPTPYLPDDTDAQDARKEWKKYITAWMAEGKGPDRKLRPNKEAFLKRIIGACSTGSVRWEKAFWFLGVRRGGKGTLLETTHCVLGRAPLAQNFNFEDFEEGHSNRFSRARLVEHGWLLLERVGAPSSWMLPRYEL